MKRLLLIIGIFLTTVFTLPAVAAGVGSGVEPIVRLYPNPATSFVTLDLGRYRNRGYSIQVFSFLGRKMYESSNVSELLRINLTDYIRGVYVYQLRDNNGKLIETGKFQVSK